MGSTSLCITPLLCLSRKPTTTSTKIFATARRPVNDGGGRRRRLVDESMMVLRKRIHEMKMMERNYEAPEDWMEWEKRYYTSYDSMICDALGVLQSVLMNTRPSLAFGMLALVILSLPTSAAFMFLHALELTKTILSN